MLGYLKAQKHRKHTANALYYKAAKQGRHPAFYEKMGVPDTLDGRFEMILLHVFVVMQAIKGTAEGDKLAQALFDTMFRDMEKSLREIGIGDLSVPRHMQRMMQGFNGRVIHYEKAVQGEENLEEVVRRNIYGTVNSVDADMVTGMVGYIRKAVDSLRGLPLQEIKDKAMLYPEL